MPISLLFEIGESKIVADEFEKTFLKLSCTKIYVIFEAFTDWASLVSLTNDIIFILINDCINSENISVLLYK